MTLWCLQDAIVKVTIMIRNSVSSIQHYTRLSFIELAEFLIIIVTLTAWRHEDTDMPV